MSHDFELLRLLLLARRFDEAVLRTASRIDGHHHVSQGLEASAAALGLVRREGDLIATNYRNHAHLLCIGTDPATMFAEILGRQVAPQFGRSGSMHLANPRLGVLYTSAMVSGGIPQAVGYGLALKRSGGESVSFCLFGDGAMQEGVAHESLNLASLWELPVVFVCENNGPEIEGRANDYQAAETLSALARVHGIDVVNADGRRPRAVVEALRDATERVRSSSRPVFLEVRAESWKGNITFYPKDVTGPTDLRIAATPSGDPWHDHHDPVFQEARDLLADGATVETLLEVDAEVTQALELAVEAAETMPESSLSLAETALTNVWG